MTSDYKSNGRRVSVADLISGREVMEELGNEIMIPNRRSSFNSRIG